MPTPAEPAPKTAICWSTRRPPETRTPDKHAGEADSSSALDVVVERAERFSVLGEDASGRRTGEVLPVQDRVGESLARARDIGVDELVVLLATDPRAAQAEVARVVEQLFAVGADIEPDGEHAARVDPAATV